MCRMARHQARHNINTPWSMYNKGFQAVAGSRASGIQIFTQPQITCYMKRTLQFLEWNLASSSNSQHDRSREVITGMHALQPRFRCGT